MTTVTRYVSVSLPITVGTSPIAQRRRTPNNKLGRSFKGLPVTCIGASSRGGPECAYRWVGMEARRPAASAGRPQRVSALTHRQIFRGENRDTE
jgi:hypothetical protein